MLVEKHTLLVQKLRNAKSFIFLGFIFCYCTLEFLITVHVQLFIFQFIGDCMVNNFQLNGHPIHIYWDLYDPDHNVYQYLIFYDNFSVEKLQSALIILITFTVFQVV